MADENYPDGELVATATGFGDKSSNHCAFAPPFRDYIQQAYEEIAQLMESAGLEARFPNESGMAFYDAYTTAQFQAAEGGALHTFLTTNDDPSVNSYVDADFLRQTVQDHVDEIRNYVLAAHPNAKFEILWPIDVNQPDTRQLNRYINLPPAWDEIRLRPRLVPHRRLPIRPPGAQSRPDRPHGPLPFRRTRLAPSRCQV